MKGAPGVCARTPMPSVITTGCLDKTSEAGRNLADERYPPLAS